MSQLKLPKCDAQFLLRLPKGLLDEIDVIASEMGGRRSDAIRLILKRGIPQVNKLLNISTTSLTNTTEANA